ncbi:RNA-guided endonuclease InsQ/TnpB family protein [Rhodococcus artemisiae]|uniref:RNA-guided endonuclease TnpB family protein n=1 Tax=Rhodococcus artemisiae TaxID=714159 RepID=A0ABU7LBZ2_9NOCA|nr:RNA-guided endonuclease TnpB family protein [Rhodococcus artemisiae]MEE2059075.1 RNA-guided endonuclease TnpB family protein [Rhodococcus artemisiae]
MRTAYKVRAYPDPEQSALLRRTFGCVRVVWNKTVADRQRRYTTEQKSTSYKDTDAALSEWKKTEELAFLGEVSSVPLQQTLRHQHTAFQSFFKGTAEYPRFKNRHSRQSAHYTRSAFRIEPDGLWLAKTTAPMKVAWSWPGIDLARLDPTMVIVSREADGRWFVTFAVDTSDPAPLPDTGESVGVDLGIKDFAVFSTGEKIGNPRHMARHERGLRRHQRRLARMQKGSNNRAKQRSRVARTHSRVRDARRDFLHKTSTDLVARFDTIAVEDLAPRNMVRNRRLAKSISECGWGEFRSMLEYKAERAGRRLVVIDRWFPSSKTCSACGHLLATLSLGSRRWSCPDCGTRHDRDVNAAKNILVAAGLAETRNACGGDVRRHGFSRPHSPVKQELSDVSPRVPVFQGGE